MAVATHSRSSSVDHDGDSIITDSEQVQPQQHEPIASTSGASVAPAEQLSPSGPICAYGSRLAYTYFPAPPPRAEYLNQLQEDVHFFSVDDQLVYLSFFQDSGPLNAACLYRFCLHVHTLLEDPSFKHKRVFLYSSDEPDKKANAALLMALYAMIVMRWSPADVLHPIACLELQPFRDAGYARADFHLSIQSCIYGIHRAIALHLLDLSTFDLVAYETYEKVENGDWNWLTPGFVAFASPVEPAYVASLNSGGAASRRIEGGRPRLSKAFDNVLNEFDSGGVRVVIRLNKKLYDAQHFKDRGMEHIEMYFDDGTNPPMEMTREFIDIADRTISAGGAVAVHCKAGLGRTGTLIGAYLIYKHGFSADEAIGFMRLMRPGSCVGPQQHYLYENQMTWVRWAAIDTLKAEQRLLNDASTSLSLSPERATAATTTPPRGKRPITPPNEDQLERSRATTPAAAAVPRTPGRPVAVPGQPRKTPGKSKHSVASPEVQHAALDEGERGDQMVEGEGVTLKEELMLVAEDDEGDVEAAEAAEREEGENLPSNSSPRAPPPPQSRLAPPPSTTRARTPTSTRPTRIARAATTTAASTRQRPLSAIADNRIVDRLGLNPGSARTTSSSSSSSTRYTASSRAPPTRSKAVKDLGTLFESAPPTTTELPGYNLRGNRTSPPSTTAAGLQPSLLPPASPSKLPQRVPAKRRGVPKEKDLPVPPPVATGARRERSITSHATARPNTAGKRQELDEVEKTIASVGLSRSVRRRRSSLGSTDFVQ